MGRSSLLHLCVRRPWPPLCSQKLSSSMNFKLSVSLSHHKHPFLIAFTYFVLLISYRSLSIHVEQGQRPKSKTDPATAIWQIDVHTPTGR
jgi:hypothetical protein